jgi:hypothetical protein
MVDQPYVEALGEHTYLIRVLEGEDTIEISMRATPEVVAQLPDDTDELRLIEVTAAYLIARQRADDLPAAFDLDDVAAAYEGYLDDIAAQLSVGTDRR